MRLESPTPAVRIALSVSVATGLYGISFGALSVAAGLNLWQTIALSALMFTGGSQFAFIGVLAGGGAGLAAFGAATLLGVRNAIYGMQMNVMLRPRRARRFLAAHVTIDESIAVAAGQSELTEAKRGFWWAGLGVFALWNVFTVLGAVLGDALGDPAVWGLDGAAVAAFLALLWPRLKSRDPVALAVVAAVVTIITIPVVPSGVPIMIAAVVAGLWGWLGSGRSAPAGDAAPGTSETETEGERA
ncbi:AzlC family ABC transporter permease [Zhihengliuella salsuginis]|uniref:Branched-chain amino acid ABC transporter permease n=1 Tax=Zhihengliuella salsuginis TaxID=578222 RepID=A0ABQ3GAX7_9MICC|nr:AzlC family ABC transporter permease [Zhihengliuella salsuginis]GHC98794.1 branched-chain amino acid ABC transporter permease [Zhihengliuella salsuginis]